MKTPKNYHSNAAPSIALILTTSLLTWPGHAAGLLTNFQQIKRVSMTTIKKEEIGYRTLAPKHGLGIANGKLLIDPFGKEFSQYQNDISFYETPNDSDFLWTDLNLGAASARWVLYREDGAYRYGRQLVAQGQLNNPPATANDQQYFSVNLQDYLPLKNLSADNDYYTMQIISTENAGDVQEEYSRSLRFTHLAQNNFVQTPKTDAYSCSGQPSQYFTRHVRVEMPIMTVLGTSNTPGDGDRDEVYLNVSTLGPGVNSEIWRLPDETGYDDDNYYEAYKHQTVKPGEWSDRDQQGVEHPIISDSWLQHGDVKTIGVMIQEQDNADLKSMKQGVIAAMHGIAAIGNAVGGYGLIVAAAAEGIAAANQFVPDTDGHDVIGFYGLRLENRCGYIQTSWITAPSLNVEGAGSVNIDFVDVATHELFESRLAVLDYGPTTQLPRFYPYGVDYGHFIFTGRSDQFWMQTNGTSGSSYRFLLKASVDLPPPIAIN